MAKLADAQDLGSCVERRGGSTPLGPIKMHLCELIEQWVHEHPVICTEQMFHRAIHDFCTIYVYDGIRGTGTRGERTCQISTDDMTIMVSKWGVTGVYRIQASDPEAFSKIEAAIFEKTNAFVRIN